MITDIPARADLPTNLPDGYPLVFVKDLAPLREFYLNTLGLEAMFDRELYLQVHLTPRKHAGPQLCFTTMPSPQGKPTEGFMLSIPVGDLDVLQQRLEAKGIPLMAPASDKPWAWRSLQIQDPAGVMLDFFHVIPETPADQG